MKTWGIIILLFVVTGVSVPASAMALANTYTANEGDNIVCYEGIVPCGLGKPMWVHNNDTATKDEIFSDGKCVTNGEISEGTICTFCHFFVMIEGIISFILVDIVPFLALIMIIAAGFMFYLAGGKPETLSKAKSFLTSVFIGLFIVYGAYIFIGFFLNAIGVASSHPLHEWVSKSAFSIDCEINVSTP